MTVATRVRLAASVGRFSPAELSPLVWLEPLTGLTDGTAVATWPDTSGNAKHAAQVTAGKRPLFKTGILNGYPVVRFDGVDDILTTPTLGASGTRTVIAVGRCTGGAGTPRLWGLGAIDASVYSHFGSNAWGWYADNAFGLIPFGGDANNFTVVSVVLASVSSIASFLDGTAGGAGNPADTYAGNLALNLAASVDGAGDYGACDIAEILVWNSALSTGDRQTAERHLGVKYGLTVA